jgi:hypothetical protein
MAAFRKLFLALAAVTVLSVTASAQINLGISCTASVAVPAILRAEGLTELVGDVTIICTGGQPTQAGAPVPQSNITIFLNTNITSRILSTSQGTWTEALLIMDEPHTAQNPAVPLLACGDANTAEQVGVNPGVCAVAGVPAGNGVGTYNPSVASPTGFARPNVWQGRKNSDNSITWSGIPFDPPGTNPSGRTIRLTNVRANASQLGVSSSLVPTQITMTITISGSTNLGLNNPTQVVGSVQPGLVTSLISPTSFLQCNSNNYNVATGSSYGAAFGDFIVRFSEGFQTAFKRKNWWTGQPSYQINNGSTVLRPATLPVTGYPAAGDQNQNVPGAVYNTESGFENLGQSADPSPNPPTQVNAGTVNGTAAFPGTCGGGRTCNIVGAGVATAGTRLEMNFASVPNGTGLWVPTIVNVVSQLTGAVTGTAVLTSTDSNGGGGFSAVGSLSGGAFGACTGNYSSSGTCPGTAGLAAVSLFNGAGIAVYEILFADPNNPERVDIPVAVGYVANPGANLPTPGVTATVAASFAPLSSVGVMSSGDPIPRFIPGAAAKNVFTLSKCTCNLLFPFVTNQIGYDTGIAIANTSLDSGTGFGTTPQQGLVTLNYYCGQPGCSSPPQSVTNAPVPAGQQLTFTLFGGGGYGIPATPGFQGYIIAQAQFQYCHAYAFISAQGEDPAPGRTGANTGYLALEMDTSFGSRTHVSSEVLAH